MLIGLQTNATADQPAAKFTFYVEASFLGAVEHSDWLACQAVNPNFMQ